MNIFPSLLPPLCKHSLRSTRVSGAAGAQPNSWLCDLWWVVARENWDDAWALARALMISSLLPLGCWWVAVANMGRAFVLSNQVTPNGRPLGLDYVTYIAAMRLYLRQLRPYQHWSHNTPWRSLEGLPGRIHQFKICWSGIHAKYVWCQHAHSSANVQALNNERYCQATW